eukprot:3719384-Prymnesium_polylepis.2
MPQYGWRVACVSSATAEVHVPTGGCQEGSGDTVANGMWIFLILPLPRPMSRRFAGQRKPPDPARALPRTLRPSAAPGLAEAPAHSASTPSGRRARPRQARAAHPTRDREEVHAALRRAASRRRRRRCSMCARESCAWAMCDGCPNAVRAQWRRGSPSDVARWPGGPDPAAPGVEDGTPGHPGELVARLCVVCCCCVRSTYERTVSV